MGQDEYQQYTGSKRKEQKIPSKIPRENKVKRDLKDVPVRTGIRRKEPVVPQLMVDSNPTLHTQHAYSGINRVRGEVLLAQLEAALEVDNYESPPVDDEEEAMLTEL